MIEENEPIKEQTVLMENRIHTRIDGIKDVNRFDEYEVSIQTEDGELTLEGEGLHISLLSVETGKIEIEGRVSGLFFSDGLSKKRKAGLLSKR